MGEIFVHEAPHEGLPNTGERLTFGHLLATDVEHFHRYYLARWFVRGKAVLDVACGEGYGAAILAQIAASVVGVDLSAEAVVHANEVYSRANLRFLEGDACAIPLPDACVEVVTSFETIEHFYDHDAFLREIKRVLRPGGLLLLSSPNRDVYSPPGHVTNDFHVRELTQDEFYRKCRTYFGHVAAFSQVTLEGSVILPDEMETRAALPVVFERRGERHVEMTEGVTRGKYCLAVASDQALPPLPASLLVHSTAIGGAHEDDLNESAIRQRDFEIERLKQENKDIGDVMRQKDRHLRESAHVLAELHARQTQIAARRRDHDVRRLSALLLSQERSAAQSLRLVIERHDAAMAEQEDRQRELEAALARARAELAQSRSTTEAVIPAPLPPTGLLRRITGRARGLSAERLLRGSALFQADWYLARYPDVGQAGLDPVRHYVRFGAAEGRDPGPGFSTWGYFAQNPDVAAAGLNPLAHYERAGRAEGRGIAAVAPATPEVVAPAPESEPEQSIIVAETIVLEAPAGPAAIRVVYLSGEPDMPGHCYRVTRHAAAAIALGAEVSIIRADAVAASLDRFAACDLLVIWRVGWGEAIAAAVEAARAAGARIQFDVDDLMVEPSLARSEVIDGIRSMGFSEEGTAAFFARVAQTAREADFCTAPTPFLAARLRRLGKPAYVLPNGFDEECWRRSRLARRGRAQVAPDGLIRIGYAAGSRTHQKDFAVAAGAVIDILRRRPDVRLVLFRQGAEPCLDVHEFPALEELQEQIEWREAVAVANIPDEMARLDVAIAPLEAGNPFCEAKSELKFFESALVEVPLVASPTGVFSAALRDGETGFLANDEAQWREALGRLVEDETLRRRVGRAAYFSALPAFGPEGRADRLRGLLAQELGTAPEAARAFELALNRDAYPPSPLPIVPPHDAEILRDGLGAAEVTVVVPLYNYVHHVLEALESVRSQTLDMIDLVVVDDGSSDNSLAVARRWMLDKAARFNRVVLVRNRANAGLGFTRNVGFAHAETPFVLPLDSDNRLLPDCAASCLAAAGASGAAFVYPTIRKFDDEDGLMGEGRYSAGQLACGNYIDAMALVRLSAWAAVGGYGEFRLGWEDYDFWCRLAERGMHGLHLPQVLALYRVHSSSMLRTVTDIGTNKLQLMQQMRRLHPWVLEGE